METVNAVSWLSVLLATICPIFSSSSRLPSIGVQISPFAYFAIKLMSSGLTVAAATMRSPSFSRSSSSTTTTILPYLISSIACSTVAKSDILLHLPYR